MALKQNVTHYKQKKNNKTKQETKQKTQTKTDKYFSLTEPQFADNLFIFSLQENAKKDKRKPETKFLGTIIAIIVM